MQLSSSTPCAVTSSKNGRPLPDADREPATDAEHHAVLQQHVERADAEQQPAREREERHADVVGEDLATRAPTPRRRDARVSRPASAARVDRLVLARHEPARRARDRATPSSRRATSGPTRQTNAITSERRCARGRAASTRASTNSRTPSASSARCTRRAGRAARAVRAARRTRIAGKAPAREREVGRGRAVHSPSRRTPSAPSRLGRLAPRRVDELLELGPRRSSLAKRTRLG